MRPWRRTFAVAALAAALAGVTGAVVVRDREGSDAAPAARAPAAAWHGLVGGARPGVALGQRVIVLLKDRSLADRVRAAGGTVDAATQRRWTAAALASQQQFLAELAERGVVARPGLRFTRVVNGFSAIADASSVALLERSPRVAGVYPVRAAFPAATSTVESPARELVAGLASFSGRGITVALLDTAVDPATPYLHGRVVPGFDVVSGGVAARYDRRPGGARLETHGTAMAGIVVGFGGPGRPAGTAPAATLLPIRVAGWQRDAAGIWSIHGRTDQIVGGLELAVDPDRDGDAHDAARVSLVPLVEPFAAFSDGPLARAVEGATTLDSLVVVPAGNDGPGGPTFGSIGGPGGAPTALTVGAADVRPAVQRVPVLVRSGLQVIVRRELDLLTTLAPPEATFELVAVRERRDVFAAGASRVAGRAVLFTEPIAPRRAVALAAEGGAVLALLAGEELPAGALGFGPAVSVPVLAAGPAAATAMKAVVARGERLWLSTGESRAAIGTRAGRPAVFTSWGLAFGGHLKPDVAAPGVGIPSALPGADRERRSRLLTASGGSAAAAVAAGLAARLANARPDLDAAGLRSALLGTARPRGSGSALAQGLGMVDPGSAADVEIVASPASVSFERAVGDGWRGRRPLELRNVSTRALTVYLAARPATPGVVLRVRPTRLRLAAGATARVRLTARVVSLSGQKAAIGTVHVAPRGGRAIRVPWTIVLARAPEGLIGAAELSETTFTPSDLTPAVLSVRIGSVQREDARDLVEPVRRFDVVLMSAQGRPLGLLARLRDALPGRYAFGITGRGPSGRVLRPGDYVLRLMAWPAAGGRARFENVPFSVE